MPDTAVSGVFLLLASALRWTGWLNGIASLMLMAFSLGMVGGDVAPPDLSWPLAFFLAGIAAAALAFVLLALARALQPRRRPWFFWPVLLLALASYGVSIAGFGAGCWLTLGDAGASDDTQQYSNT
ncbi:hypothetical protein [Bordetella pseudohinzii]|uniref:Uncharacterized protein n=1 Tax=Bordetella pseudohinzii TaxID=1331258 RepID=A0A0J6EYU2_9BORD|nr:hypothetical protein [Bordetella pseudohinzii]ANY16736.1 hypothetical protein BBN53_13080 [Bordetella pseudohinzii]KMM25515.1 membrane protein [Bordetella pseudohinzii]KXA76780.1 hypothetical protein AW878_17100 [Bordetella pseudohinzii]KXA76979.1 hypothetical protein AW877_15385 [Bordetella pseudohinzii]CUI90203.1 Uncharacterised protein [Bordetella pseudohinzii]